MGHCLGVWGSSHEGIYPNPATFPDPFTFQITDVLPLFILEMANFAYMAMTERCTVLVMGSLSPWFLVTQEDLDTGCVTTRFRFCTLGKPLSEFKEGKAGGVRPEMNAELDMAQSVIDILEGAKSRMEFIPGFNGARDGWTKDIQIYAPGYLQMEAEGNEADYDHSHLIDPEDAD